MKWGLVIADGAKRPLRRLSSDDRKEIVDALYQMAEDPFAAELKLVRGLHCFRRGDSWRIMFELCEPERILMILAIIGRK